MSPETISIPRFAQAQLQLLLQEHEAEISSSSLANTAASVSPSTRRTLQATGYALTGIVLSQCRTGLGGRVVGEFTADAAVSSSKSTTNKIDDDRAGADGEPRLGAHGIRVGDIVRVNDTSGSGSRKLSKDRGKAGGKDAVEASKGPEGVVTRVGERSIWIAFGQRGGSGRSKEDDEAIEELWGKKLWLYVLYRSMQRDSLVFGTAPLLRAVSCSHPTHANGRLQHKTCKRRDVPTVCGLPPPWPLPRLSLGH